jgi:hypothetical protein
VCHPRSGEARSILGAQLSYWDEVVAYAALYFLIGGINLPSPA